MHFDLYFLAGVIAKLPPELRLPQASARVCMPHGLTPIRACASAAVDGSEPPKLWVECDEGPVVCFQARV